LNDEYPHDHALAPLAVLLAALEAPERPPFADRDAASAARAELTDRIAPAAQRLLGEVDAATWLAPLWRRIAHQAQRLPFRAEHSDDHAAALWLRAGDWPEAAAAAARIESWRRIPAPLAWMAEARYRIDGLDAVWALLAELAWLAPGRFDMLVRRLGDPNVDRLRKQFDAEFDGVGDVSDLAWFPAWVLTEQPALAPRLAQAQASQPDPPEQAMRLLLMLLGLERRGRHHELIERRKALRDLHPSLFAAYMKTR